MSPVRPLLRRLFGVVPRTDRSDDRADASEGDDPEEASVWRAIPYGQWGRLAETGGITKARQSDAVRTVQERAAEIEDVEEY